MTTVISKPYLRGIGVNRIIAARRLTTIVPLSSLFRSSFTRKMTFSTRSVSSSMNGLAVPFTSNCSHQIRHQAQHQAKMHVRSSVTSSSAAAAQFSSSSSSNNHDIQIVEVSPRDGLQNEILAASGILTSNDKIELIWRLVNDAGITNVEMGSFVSPKWVPAMSDSEQVIQGYYNASKSDSSNSSSKMMTPQVQSSVLIPNIKGLQRALSLKDDDTGKPLVNEIAIAASASDLFAFKNWNCKTSTDLIVDKCLPVAQALHEYNIKNSTSIKLRGYISCVVGCPYQGKIKPIDVAKIVEQLLQLPGMTQISLGDTIGIGTPTTIRAMLDEINEVIRGGHGNFDNNLLAAHYHDTYGQALSNILASIEHPTEIRCIDSSVAGLGGCPYAKGASGNVATEDVVYMLHGMGLSTGIDLDKLVTTGDWICNKLQSRPNGSKVALAMLGSRNKDE